MTVNEIVAKSAGYCCCDDELRRVIKDNVYGRGGRTIDMLNDDGEVVAHVSILDDESGHAYNAENTCCAVAQITPVGGEPIFVGYYSDGAQHVLDILDGERTVEEWAAEWDSDGLLPEYLGRQAGSEEE